LGIKTLIVFGGNGICYLSQGKANDGSKVSKWPFPEGLATTSVCESLTWRLLLHSTSFKDFCV